MAEYQAAEEATTFLNLKYTAERNDGVIPVEYRELMSVAVALTTQCSYCVEAHIKNAIDAGATQGAWQKELKVLRPLLLQKNHFKN